MSDTALKQGSMGDWSPHFAKMLSLPGPRHACSCSTERKYRA